MKSGSLILLEPSGPVQVCNGIALPRFFYTKILYVFFYFLSDIYMTHILNHNR